MALATEKALLDMFKHGTGVASINGTMTHYIQLHEFWHMPEPGERNPWTDRVYFPWEPYDDGGGAAIAAFRYELCPFAPA